ncbi:30S ribosomal protein S3 [Fusibacter bizertensis]|jgi:small subunit ribosomal protein S3|uniref:Small ribosomal subunit protein uS3 n=1 Tax=Fusibacter bizertensis TaxID=1488331 RepID=A0ABT6NH77_9FIRM|nr:30S ribosomal protein S3 [Fusibacter bizertensis]MDH8679788.1 30S ribosomal protein S3 [Fusibacter bizertensis]
MGQKVSPHGLRVGVIKDWDSKWYANKKNFADLLIEDYGIRKYVKKRLFTAGISRIYIDRTANDKVHINIFTAKPGMVVGKGGENIKVLREELEKMTKKSIQLDISEVDNVDIDAQLVAENVAFSLEKRVSFRRAMKQVIGRALKSGAEGVKVQTSGRLGGAEMARTEGYSEGNVPLSTLRADIDYGFAEADTTYGKIGVKVWINKGEVLPSVSEETRLKRKEARKATDRRPQRSRNANAGPNRGPRKPRNNNN